MAVVAIASGPALGETAATRAGPAAASEGVMDYGCRLDLTWKWDNGDTDGSDGYSNAVESVFGARRTLLDDFVVPPEGVEFHEFLWRHIWSSAPPGSGSNVEIDIRSDAGGAPGAVLMTLQTAGYRETPTGRVWFESEEVESLATLMPFTLSGGTYWIDFTVVGPDNNFAMVKEAEVGSVCWLDYDDFGGLSSCPEFFGPTTDLTFALCGKQVAVELLQFDVD